MSSFDDLITELGGFGPYQKLTIFLLCIPATFLNACGYDLVFMLYAPEKSCRQWNVNETFIRDHSINSTDPCMYEGITVNGQSIHCLNWTWDKNYFDQTLRTQWDVCRDDFLAKNTLGIFILVSVIGLCVMSVIQDYFGRKTAFLICLTMHLLGSGFSLFAPSLETYVLLRSLREFQSSTSYVIPFIWAEEFVASDHRTLVNFLITLLFSTAAVCLGLFAYASRTWVHLGVITGMPFILLYSYSFLVDESPRWLLSVGKIDEACRVVQKMAQANGRIMSNHEIRNRLKWITAASSDQHIDHERFKPLQLFRTFNLRMIVVLLTVVWVANALVYNTMAFNAPNLGNIYWAYIAQASVEAPACVFNLLLSNRIGRIPPMILSMLGSAFFSFMCLPAYIGNWNEWCVIIFAALAKFGICISYNILFQTTGELYPTSLRAIGSGFNYVAANLFATAIPFILNTAVSEKWLPMLILAVITTTAAVCACFLPETMGKPMPQSALEAETMSKVGPVALKEHVANVMKCNVKSK